MNAVKTVSLFKTYTNGNIEISALKNVSIEIEKGEFVSITGQSGSGKTTLLNMIGGLDYPSGGSICINGIQIENMREDELSIFRREQIGFVFQKYNLLPVLNVYENIVLPQKLQKKDLDTAFIEDIAETLGITDKLWQMPENLSGGQQQRVAIARALSTKPAIVLADEPTGNLDSKTGREVIALIKEMAEKYEQTIVIVTHSEEVALEADRIIQIEDGEILSESIL